ncbi:MAG: hypothetical protein WCW66_04695 [Patescibacteria group bacterium]
MREIGFNRANTGNHDTPPEEETQITETISPEIESVVPELPLTTKTEIRQELTDKLTSLLQDINLQNDAFELTKPRQKGEIPRPRTLQPGTSELAEKFKVPGVAEIVMQKTQREFDELKSLLDNLDSGTNYDSIALYLDNIKTKEENRIDTEIETLSASKKDPLGILAPTPGTIKKRMEDKKAQKENETRKRLDWVQKLRNP